MNTGQSTQREKRPRSSNDVNNSFVKNVTSRVSGLLSSTITKWFSSPSSSNGSAPVAESSDSSTEDETSDSQIIQPPSKRMRFSSPSTSNTPLTLETKCTSTNTECMETYSIAQSPIRRNTFKLESNYVSTPLHSPSESTCISEHEKDTSEYKFYNSWANIGNSIVKKRISLSDVPDKIHERSSDSIRDLSQTHLKPGLFGSPFYSGKTRYGGAASSYMDQPNIKHRKERLVSNSSNNDNIAVSQATRRVMDILENYSSPLIEAKRISQSWSSKTAYDNSTTKNAHKTNELYVPSIAKILRLKQKSKLMASTSAARQIIASNSSSIVGAPYSASSSHGNSKGRTEKFTMKLKTRVTRPKQDDGSHDINIQPTVQLPTAILQIDQNNLPKFTLGTPVIETTPTIVVLSSSSSSTLSSNLNISYSKISTISMSTKFVKTDDVPVVINEKSQVTIDENPYKFSRPVIIDVETIEHSSPLPNYTFGFPERQDIEQLTEKDNDKYFKTGSKGNPPLQSEGNKKGCNDEFDSKEVKGLEKQFKVGAKKSSNTKESEAKLTPSSSWKCKNCGLCNYENVDKCVFCCGKKTKSIPLVNAKMYTTDNDWICDICWIKNSNIDKCAACGGPKSSSTEEKSPKSIPLVTVTRNTTDVDWKCDVCWIKNNSKVDKCAACGGERPGTHETNKDFSNKSSSKIFHNDSITNSQTGNDEFESNKRFCPITKVHDIKKQSQICIIRENSKHKGNDEQQAKLTSSSYWKCKNCCLCNNENEDKCVLCSGKKPKTDLTVAAKTNTLDNDWNCDICWIKNNNNVEKCAACGGAKPSNTQEKNSETVQLLTDKLNTTDSDWKCVICWIKNKNDIDKCAACGGEKPLSTQGKNNDSSNKPSSQMLNNDTVFKKIIQSQTDKWECPNCLVCNENNVSVCICCDAEKPGVIKESAKGFNFGTIKGHTFKFGIDPNQNVSEKQSEPRSTIQTQIAINESETNNNVVPKPLSFNFGMPNQKKSDKDITEESTEAETTPKEPFKFGVSKAVRAPIFIATNLFSTPSLSNKETKQSEPIKNSIETDEKIQEVPNIEEAIPSATETPQKSAGLFGIASNTSLSGFVSFGQTEDAKTQATPAVSTTVADAKVPQSTFVFPTSNIKLDQTIFSASASTASTTTSFSTLQAPLTASFDFFHKNDSTSTLLPESDVSSITLFNKTTARTTAAVQPDLSSGPVFSFGGSSQNPPIVEKPKFNFTLRNNPEIPLFSVTTSSTSGSTLSGNGLSNSNVATSTIITGGNGVASGNSVRGNGLSSTQLSSGMLAGPAKNDNVLWPSTYDLGSHKMPTGNGTEQSVNSSPSMASGNLFTAQIQKENTWSLNQNTSNDPLSSIKLTSGNNLDSANNTVGNTQGTIFGAPEKKENMWSLTNNNSTNSFLSNTVSNALQKPAPFTFGSSMQFNSNSMTPAPTFGSAQPAQNIFGMSNQQNNNQTAMFATPLQNTAPTNLFGGQQVGNTAASVEMFGTPNAAAAPQFGTPAQSMPSFEAAPVNPVSAPNFNFGAQQTSGVFGFGQQQQQPQQGAVYNFGSPQRFNIGTASSGPNAVNRRVIRKAVRRTTQR